MAGTKNLKPVRTVEEAKEKGRNGGIKSGVARREKKLLSQIYAETLAEKFGVDGSDLKTIIADVIKSKSPAAVSLLKELREATEGSKMIHSGDVENPVKIIINPVGE